MVEQLKQLHNERLVTIAHTCEILGISRPTIYRWIKDAKMAFPVAIKIGPNSVRFRLTDVEAFINHKMGG